MKKLYIKDLKAGQKLAEECFLINKFKKATTANNKEYWNLVLADKTGEMNAKVWEDNLSKCQQCDEGQIILVSGKVDEFKGKKQIIIDELKVTQDFEISEFIAKTSKDIDQMYKTVEKNIEKVKNKHIKKLLDNIFQNKEFAEELRQAPGAEKIHHAYIGGLLEHISEMLNIAEVVVKEYENINQDLLICGILLHDIGKIKELSVNTKISRTLEGKFIGHLVLGAMFVSAEIDKIPDFPAHLKNKIIHLILSHHGKLEFGSPVKPALLESVALYYIDEISAKTNIADNLFALGKDSPELFSERHFALENSEIYIGNDEQEEKQQKLI